MPLPKLKNSLSVKLALDSVLQIRKLVFLLWLMHPKKYPKLSVKLVQSGRDLAQSVKLGVQENILDQFGNKPNTFGCNLEIDFNVSFSDFIRYFILAMALCFD